MYTPITLDKDRNMRLGMKAFSLIEEKMKKPIAKLDIENMTMKDMATIIWAGLFHEDRGLTVDKVIDLVDEYSNIKDTMEIVRKAMGQSFGVDDKEKSEEVSEEKN